MCCNLSEGLDTSGDSCCKGNGLPKNKIITSKCYIVPEDFTPEQIEALHESGEIEKYAVDTSNQDELGNYSFTLNVK